MLFWEIVIGALGGIIGGMGMGGGSLTIPLLTIFLSYEQLLAQGVNLVAFLPMSLVALCIHIKNKLVDFKSTWALAVVGCLFSLGGAILANHIENKVLKILFALFLIALGIWQLVEMIKEVKKEKTKKQKIRRRKINNINK